MEQGRKLLARPLPRFRLCLNQDEAKWLCRALDGEIKIPDDEAVAFGRSFAHFIGARRAWFLPSARMGLYLALRQMKLPAGAGVILPSLTHPSVPQMVVACGLTPLFADVDPDTCLMEARNIPSEYWTRARVVIVTHLYGCPCPMEDLSALPAEHQVAISEDCAQSCGATWRGRRTGSFGDAAYFSFALTKNFTTLGGGMLVTSQADLAQGLDSVLGAGTPVGDRMVRSKARMGRLMDLVTGPNIFPWALYPFLRLQAFLGHDFLHQAFAEPVATRAPSAASLTLRPAPIQAGLGLIQLDSLDAKNGRRMANGKRLLELLSGIPGLGLPAIPAGSDHIFMTFLVRHPRRDALARALIHRGVDTSPGYLGANSAHPAFTAYRAACPNAEAIARQQLHLPIYPDLSPTDLEGIADALREAVAGL